VPITVAEAYKGAKVKVPTIEGFVSLKVPPKSQSGPVVRLRGKGVAKRGRPEGDLYVHFEVQIPTQDDPKLAALVDQFAAFQTADPREKLAL
jgi:curved DNA-binding protein